MSLRRTDVSTRYSGKQLIVILMDANSEGGDMVARRIIECFGRIYTGGRIKISYDIAKVEGKLADIVKSDSNPN